MQLPHSKLQGIIELKHSEMPELFLRLLFPLHIPFDSPLVPSFANRRHIVLVGLKLPTP
jgi:hypothetical protein